VESSSQEKSSDVHGKEYDMLSAFVLIQLGESVSDPQKIHTSLHAIDGVKTVHLLAGPTDMIVFVEGRDQAAFMAALMKIRAVQGVESTDTRIVFPL
jgi:DNA-binding Lrp family transcriptional regulator